MADESLVPQGLPYGERKRQVEGMRAAGLPLAPPAAAGSGPLPAPAAAPLPPLSAPSADPLLALAPAADYQPADPKAGLRRLASESPNGFVRALLGRMLAEDVQ